MNKKGFIDFLEKKKKSERAINSYTDFVRQYESYLFEHKKGKKICMILKNGGKNNVKINRCLWGIKEYYDYISKEELKLETNAMFGERMDL
ncbi:MAG: hypothetical protein AB1Z29_03080 [Desulfobacterales bacterium]